jgi:hypothetical protein
MSTGTRHAFLDATQTFSIAVIVKKVDMHVGPEGSKAGTSNAGTVGTQYSASSEFSEATGQPEIGHKDWLCASA